MREFPVGTQIRVWTTPEGSRDAWLGRPHVRAERVAGMVVRFPAPNRVQVRKTGWVPPWTWRERTLFWSQVEHLDVGDGRQEEAGLVKGAMKGMLKAVLVSAVVKVSSSLLACFDNPPPCGPSFGTLMAISAAFFVPYGAFRGYYAVQWRAVF